MVLNGGNSGPNSFTVNGWTGTVTLNGGAAGGNLVTVDANIGMGVNGNVVGDNSGLSAHENNITTTVLQGGSGNIVYTVNAWNTGNLWFNGGTGTNTYNIGTAATENLDTILQNVGINAAGTANAIVLYDQKNNTFANYTLTPTSISSFQNVLNSPRLFGGVTVHSGTITSETLYANAQGSNFYVTPGPNTTYDIVGALNTPTQNTLNLPASGPQSPTLFITNGTGFVPNGDNNGLYMFANDKPVQFANMAQTNSTTTVGAVNAVSAVAGSASSSTVTIINSVTGQTLQTIPNTFPGYSGGVQVAVGNVLGNGIPDLVVAPGVSQSPTVKIYSILTGQLIEQFLAQTSTFDYGIRVAIGDVTGNGRQDIITAPMVGPANVNVFLNNGSSTTPFAAYSASTPTIHAFSTFSGYEGGTGGIAVGNLPVPGLPNGNTNGAGSIVVGSGVGIAAQGRCSITP